MKSHIKLEIENRLKNAFKQQQQSKPKPITSEPIEPFSLNQLEEIKELKSRLISKLSLTHNRENLKNRLKEKNFSSNFKEPIKLKELLRLCSKQYKTEKKREEKIRNIFEILKPFSFWELKILYLNSIAYDR